ncbi:UDP-glycosyltransferase 73D1-like [Euphorbia lathyris]|uniref:UDP-glycosyltransferase 73D1-like n=1 Tax=Euphorbia lathyris TaxID=212925 RepID=UPI003313A455
MAKQPHFVLIPLFTQGHLIPIIDMAKLIAQRGVIVSLVTTPQNASRFNGIIHRATTLSGLPIRLVVIPFPSQEAGLPAGYENLDTLPSRNMLKKFYVALANLQLPLETLLERASPPLSCIISDKCVSWTVETAKKFDVPRIVFHGMGSFSLLSAHNIRFYHPHLSVSSDFEPFAVPGMPQGFRVSRAQLPGSFVSLPDLDDVRNKMQEAESTAFGVVVNSFEELENGCPKAYQKAIRKRVWCVGPVSLCNKENLDKFERGNIASIDEQECSKWLDLKKPRSVIYACLGSLCRLEPSQLLELGLGLEASNQPFIWVVKTGEKSSELDKWLADEMFEERTKGRGLLIKGWSPQVLILSHPAIGGFLTHCGWNSTVEGVCSGVPMITWPLFSEQFLNEKLIVEILKIGVRVGVEIPVRWGEEEKVGVLVKKEEVEKAIRILMDEGEEGMKRRKKAIELAQMARKSMEIGGSSYSNLSLLIQHVLEYQTHRKAKGLESEIM